MYDVGYRMDSMSALIRSIAQDRILDHALMTLVGPSSGPAVLQRERSQD